MSTAATTVIHADMVGGKNVQGWTHESKGLKLTLLSCWCFGLVAIVDQTGDELRYYPILQLYMGVDPGTTQSPLGWVLLKEDLV
jgi:hypothetical protein